MSQKHQTTALEKEFELERVILFSDAVFAIAITLLIIDIKWPEGEHLSGEAESKLKLVAPMIKSFGALIISFFFITVSGPSTCSSFACCRNTTRP